MRLIDADLLSKQYGLDDATKYGNKNAKQQDFSYSTMMMYEIADMIDDAPTVNAIPISVIEDIRADIMALEPQYPIDDNTPYISSQSVWKIINKHCGGDNNEID